MGDIGLIQHDEIEFINALASRKNEDARNEIRNSRYYNDISRLDPFYRVHLRRMRLEQTTPYKTLVRDRDLTTNHRFALFPYEENEQYMDFTESRANPVSSCDGIIGLFSQAGRNITFQVCNPYRGLTTVVGTTEVRQNRRCDSNTLSIGFGRGDELRYFFYIFYPSSRELQVINIHRRSSRIHNQSHFIRLTGRLCDVTIDGVPYWRGFFRAERRIFHPVRFGVRWSLNSIDYPVMNQQQVYVQSKLIELNQQLAFVNHFQEGQNVEYYISLRRNRQWSTVIGGNFSALSSHIEFYVTPNNRVIFRGHGNDLFTTDDDNNQVTIGHVDIEILNHQNTLAYVHMERVQG